MSDNLGKPQVNTPQPDQPQYNQQPTQQSNQQQGYQQPNYQQQGHPQPNYHQGYYPPPPNIIINNTNTNTNTNTAGQPYPYKKKMTALLLCIFLGFFGIHRFYVGKNLSGILYLFTGGLFAIGWMFDIFSILIGGFRDKAGYPLQ